MPTLKDNPEKIDFHKTEYDELWARYGFYVGSARWTNGDIYLYSGEWRNDIQYNVALIRRNVRWFSLCPGAAGILLLKKSFLWDKIIKYPAFIAYAEKETCWSLAGQIETAFSCDLDFHWLGGGYKKCYSYWQPAD